MSEGAAWLAAQGVALDALDDRLQLGEDLVLVGRSKAFRRTVEALLQIARHDVTVLVEGETGTGKELVARALHQLSGRCRGPFVEINCAALPGELAESELFGHLKGAFTHAFDRRVGLVAEAHKGTLFLDEVASLPLPLQAKLLRFLQSGEYREVGSNRSQKADVRVVAAANVPLLSAANEGHFRSDLYYRLAVFRIAVPALSERPEDIAPLARHFLDRHAARLRLPPSCLSMEALARLERHAWPGNVRELENRLQRALVQKPGTELGAEDLFEDLEAPAAAAALAGSGCFRDQKAAALRSFELQYLQNVMRRSRGNVSKAAREAGLHRRALTALLAKHGLKREAFLSREASELKSSHS